eukprot:2823636-Pleurochrysis_carterae.AAC.2
MIRPTSRGAASMSPCVSPKDALGTSRALYERVCVSISFASICAPTYRARCTDGRLADSERRKACTYSGVCADTCMPAAHACDIGERMYA